MNRLTFPTARILFVFMVLLATFACTRQKQEETYTQGIKPGIAKVSGKIIYSASKENNTFPDIEINTTHPIVGEGIAVTGQVNQDGSFEMEIPVECQTLAGLRVGDFWGIIGLTPNEKTHLEITLTDTGISNVIISDKLGLTGSDVVNYFRVLYEETYNYRAKLPPLDYCLSPDSFAQNYIERIEQTLPLIKNNPTLSAKGKELAIIEYKFNRLLVVPMDYKGTVKMLHSNEMSGQGRENDPNDFVPEEPGKSYYAFLRYFDLDNPINLQTADYNKVLQSILENETLQISPIGETPIETWLSGVKSIMSELVGFNEGLFYDLLASNSYARQFNNELKPLSDKQKENINNYFKGKKGEIAKILLRRNDEIIKLDANKDPLVVNETPAVSKEKLMNAIISKYQGKVIVVDFWATWCGPCLNAMKEYRTVKSELKGKNVVFVYITDGSSPKNLWEEKIKGIGGEHYYLNDDECEHLMGSFDFEGIPSYVIFDVKGKLHHKFTSYPGNEEMQKMIEKLL